MSHDFVIDEDRRWLSAALRLSRRHSGKTWPNPCVAAIITQTLISGKQYVIGRGVTQQGGRPHAERIALNQAGDNAKNGCCYVTLEPCAHQGITPPCASALIEAGINRVVCPVTDPDKRVAGQGIMMLRNAGVEVIENILPSMALRSHCGHFRRVQHKLPFIRGKMALSAEGYIGEKNGSQIALTSAQTNKYMHRYRLNHDALLVGVDTVIADNPQLTARIPGVALAEGPVRIVLDSQLRIPLSSYIVNSATKVPTWLMVSSSILSSLQNKEKCKQLEDKGVRLLMIEQDEEQKHLNLHKAFQCLANEGITTVFIETGAKLYNALCQEKLMDEFLLLQTPTRIKKEDKVFIRVEGNITNILYEAGLIYKEQYNIGDDKVIKYTKE